MQSNVRKMMQIAATLFLVLGLASTAWAQLPWRVNDVVVCYNTGKCAVLRINGTSVQLLPNNTSNNLSDGLGGDTNAGAINNTLHLLTTDTGMNPSTLNVGSNIVKYSMASVDPSNGSPTSHTVLKVFDGSNGGTSLNITGLAINSAGHMFAGNNGNPFTIVEINQDRPSWQPNTAYASGFTIVDPALHVQKVTMAGTSGAIQPTFDDSGSTTPDGTNGLVWTDQGLSVSSFKLSPNVTTPGWTANTAYPITSSPPTVNQILDPNGHVQQVSTPGTSGTVLPPFNQFGGTTTDALTWTNLGMPVAWASGNYPIHFSCLDLNGKVEEVTTAGITGATQPTNWSTAVGGTTQDGSVVWTNRGTPGTWVANTDYLQPFAIITDSSSNIEEVTNVGRSRGGTHPDWNMTLGAITVDNPISPVIWTDLGSPVGGTCIENQLNSLDLSTDGGSVYFTSGPTSGPGGIIQKVTGLSTCTVFADFGPSVTLSGIRVIPPGALPATCSSSDQTATPCPTGESLLVVATGKQYIDEPCFACSDLPGDPNAPGAPFLDPTEFSVADDYLDVCTTPMFGPSGPLNGISGTPTDSCALLLDINALGLPAWIPNHAYSFGDKILDPLKHVQKVTVPGTSALVFHPTFDDNGTHGTTTDNTVTWQDQGTAIIRYPVSDVNTLHALALDPLVSDCATTSCSSSVPPPKVTNFWLADANSAKFFKVPFTRPTSPPDFTTYNATTACPACNSAGLHSITIYGAEDAAQPGLTQLPSVSLSTPSSNGTNTTNTAQFDFNPNPQLLSGGTNDDNQLKVTGYNFPSGFTSGLALTVYASAIDPASGFSDSLLTPTPPSNALVLTPSAPCTVATSTSQCVIWQLDNNDLPPISTCATKPSTCPFMWVKLDFFNATVKAPPFDPNNVIGVLDERYDVTASPDTGFPKVKCQLSQHTITPQVQGAANCTYVSPLPPSSSSPSACFTTSRTNIPVKFNCASLPAGKTLADLLPFLHVFQVFSPSGNEASLQPLQGTGGTINYRLTSGQWNFNLNNPGFGYTPTATRADYQACTKDASGNVELFCTKFYVKKSCP